MENCKRISTFVAFFCINFESFWLFLFLLHVIFLSVMSWRLIIWISFLYPQQYDLRNPQPSVILSTHVSSSKSGGTMSLEGLNLSLSERWIWWLSLIATLLPKIFLLSSRHQTLHVMLGFNIVTVMNFTREVMKWKPKKFRFGRGFESMSCAILVHCHANRLVPT